jgi:transcription elongation factor GreB
VFFGAWITLEDDDGQQVTYRIVGADEISPDKGWISMDSPMARALMKKTLDDEVQVETPAGMASYTVIEVSYQR